MSKHPSDRFCLQNRLHISRRLGHALLLSAMCCNFALAAGGTDSAAEDIDLVEIVRKPEIGNYRGYAEFKMAHYATARRIWEALDERNFGEAAFNLGLLYEDGLGVEKNIDRALSYYRRGAANGSAKAVFRVGIVLAGHSGHPEKRNRGPALSLAGRSRRRPGGCALPE